jgi:hypothetical protein
MPGWQSGLIVTSPNAAGSRPVDALRKQACGAFLEDASLGFKSQPRRTTSAPSMK